MGNIYSSQQIQGCDQVRQLNVSRAISASVGDSQNAPPRTELELQQAFHGEAPGLTPQPNPYL